MKDLEKHFEDIKSGKIKDYAILGMDEKRKYYYSSSWSWSCY